MQGTQVQSSNKKRSVYIYVIKEGERCEINRRYIFSFGVFTFIQ